MTELPFLWGLSNGIMMLAIAGTFWLGLGIGLYASRLGGLLCALLTVLQAGGLVTLLWGAYQLRRKVRFRASELRHGEERARMEARHILKVFCGTVVIQTALIALAVWWCVRAQAEQMIWPFIALVISLHLLPFGKIFHVRMYYVTAVLGSVVSLVTFAVTEQYGLAFLACGMTAVMWGSATYLLSNADRIAARALKEPWAT
jgi:hypothetical protein